VIEALSDESVEPSYPGLDGLALRLTAVNEKKNESLLRHKDNEVRLYILMACFKTFAIYAPEPPFSPEAAFEIFTQLIAQLANLSHTTLDTQPNYHNYFSILEHLSQGRTGIILVEYYQRYSGAIAIAACIAEFQMTIPTCILDVLLSCIFKRPKIWVHPAIVSFRYPC